MNKKLDVLMDETPHKDSVLFQRVRNWFRDKKNVDALSSDQAKAVAPLLRDLKARKILLTFASIKPDQRHDSGRSSYLADHKTGAHIIELHLHRSWSGRLTEIDDTALGYAARDMLTLYERICSTQKPKPLSAGNPKL